jgi:hypothetical protein
VGSGATGGNTMRTERKGEGRTQHEMKIGERKEMRDERKETTEEKKEKREKGRTRKKTTRTEEMKR